MRRASRVAGLVALVAGLGGAGGGCGNSATEPAPAGPVFVIEVAGERFRAAIADSATRARARQLLQSGAAGGVLHGTLARGDGGFNRGYSWHLVPETVQFVDVAMELCDGRPSLVQQNLDYFMTNVVYYCPWHTKVVAEEG